MPGHGKPETDREKLEAVADGYHKLMAAKDEQRRLVVQMIRACVSRVKSPDPVKRREGIKGLDDLANQLENSR